MNDIKKELAAEFDRIPKVDVHTHLWYSAPSARRVTDLVFYHMIAAELRSAGMDMQKLKTLWGRQKETDIDSLLESTGDYLPLIANTALARALGTIASDLFGVEKKISEKGFLQDLSDALGDGKNNFERSDTVFQKMNMKTAVAPLPHRHSIDYHKKHSQHVSDDGESEFKDEKYSRLVYSLERDPFRPVRDMKRYMDDIEKYYGIRPVDREKATELITSQLEDAKSNGICTQVKWLSPDYIAMEPDDAVIDGAFRKTENLESWTAEEISNLNALEMKIRLEHAREEGHPFQICVTSVYMDGLQYTAPFTPERFQRIVARWIGDYPEVDFDVVNCDYAYDQFFSSLARTHRNVYLTGIWWHGMSEGWIEDMMYRRLLMVPISKLNGFFSDGYCTEWVYGKLFLMKRGLVNAFSRAVTEDAFSLDEAKQYLRQMMFDNPTRLFNLTNDL